jgi:hypothetical protein
LRKQSSIGSTPSSKQKDKSTEKDKMNGVGGLRINEMSIEEINKLIEERVLKVCVCKRVTAQSLSHGGWWYVCMHACVL